MKSYLLELPCNFFLLNTELRKVKITMFYFYWENNRVLFGTMIERLLFGQLLPPHYDLMQKGQKVTFHYICKLHLCCVASHGSTCAPHNRINL